MSIKNCLSNTQIAILILLFSSCTIFLPGPPLILSDDPREAMREIGSVYIEGVHSCGDMAQEFRDYLIDKGVDARAMRLVSAHHEYFTEMHHLWLEIKYPDGWRVFDPALQAYAYTEREGDVYSEYSTRIIVPGDWVLREEGGYQHRGDRFVNGEWRRAK